MQIETLDSLEVRLASLHSVRDDACASARKGEKDCATDAARGSGYQCCSATERERRRRICHTSSPSSLLKFFAAVFSCFSIVFSRLPSKSSGHPTSVNETPSVS